MRHTSWYICFHSATGIDAALPCRRACRMPFAGFGRGSGGWRTADRPRPSGVGLRAAIARARPAVAASSRRWPRARSMATLSASFSSLAGLQIVAWRAWRCRRRPGRGRRRRFHDVERAGLPGRQVDIVAGRHGQRPGCAGRCCRGRNPRARASGCSFGLRACHCVRGSPRPPPPSPAAARLRVGLLFVALGRQRRGHVFASTTR